MIFLFIGFTEGLWEMKDLIQEFQYIWGEEEGYFIIQLPWNIEGGWWSISSGLSDKEARLYGPLDKPPQNCSTSTELFWTNAKKFAKTLLLI